MPQVKKTFSDEQAKEWKDLYESGYSNYDMTAYESARGRNTSWYVIKREIERIGGKIRSFNETIQMRDQRRIDKKNDR